MAKALSTLLPLMSVPRCPQPKMLQALRAGCRQFCRDTEMWRETLTGVSTVADQSDYTLTLGYDDVLLLRVFRVEIDGIEQDESHWAVSEDNILTLSPPPAIADKTITAYAVLMPSILCNSVADRIIDRWGEGIAARAEFSLKTDKGSEIDPNPWYDPQTAGIALNTYNDVVGEAKAELFSQMQSGQKRILPGVFG